MSDDYTTKTLLAKRIISPFRDKESGGVADLGDDAWWVEDMLDRIERAIVPHLAPLRNESEEAGET